MAEYDFMFNGDIVQNPKTGRWFIGAGQPGFNCDTNNRSGWAHRIDAAAMRDHYAIAGKPMNLENAVQMIEELNSMLSRIGLGDKVSTDEIMEKYTKGSIFVSRYKMYPQERS